MDEFCGYVFDLFTSLMIDPGIKLPAEPDSASCRIDFPHKYNSGQDLVVFHKERYVFPSKKEHGKQLWEYTKKNTRDVAYHCSTDCLMKRLPYFTKQRLGMKREVLESCLKPRNSTWSHLWILFSTWI